MIALDGDLYVYGGVRQVADGEDNILYDVIVAKAHNGIVNQPWKRILISASCSPHNFCNNGRNCYEVLTCPWHEQISVKPC